jgi:hypothetical protein
MDATKQSPIVGSIPHSRQPLNLSGRGQSRPADIKSQVNNALR